MAFKPKKHSKKKTISGLHPVKLVSEFKKAKSSEVPIYTAIALQLATRSVTRCIDRDSSRAHMSIALDHIKEKVTGTKNWVGTSAKLIVLPEYLLTSFPQGETISGWADKAAIDIDGPEYERFGQIAQDNALYLAGNAYESDKFFPGYYFQTSFIVGPSGDVILRYRRLNSMYSPTPHDVWDKYLDLYGLDGVFPVVDTDIGRLAPIASEEILYPEVARCFAMRGAEVFVHSSSELSIPSLTNKDAAKVSRAVENMAYVVSCNTAGIHDTGLTDDSANGGSRIVDYKGQVIRIAGPGENASATAEIDVTALRRQRRQTGLGNTLIRQRFEAYAASYAANVFQPANSLIMKDGSLKKPERKHFVEAQKGVISRLEKKGII